MREKIFIGGNNAMGSNGAISKGLQNVSEMEEVNDKVALDTRVSTLIEELSMICNDRNHVLTEDSLEFISNRYSSRPVKLEVEKVGSAAESKQKKSSGKSRYGKDFTRRQRVEELTRFFMEGRSTFEMEANRRSKDDEDDNESDTEGESKEIEDADDESEVPGAKIAQHFQSLIKDAVDPRTYNLMLLSIRETDPLLYGAILCSPLIAGKCNKKGKKEKDSNAADEPTMLNPDFDAEQMTDEDFILNLSRLVAKCISENSIRALLIALKVVLSALGDKRFEKSEFPLVAHLRVLAGEEPPQVPKKLDKTKTLEDKKKRGVSSADAEGEDDDMASLTAQLSRFVGRGTDSSASEASELDEEALMAQAIALSLSSEMDSQSTGKDKQGGSNDEGKKQDDTDMKPDTDGVNQAEVTQPDFPRPAPFSAAEMQLLIPFKVLSSDKNVDLQKIAMSLISKITDHCTTYAEDARNGVLKGPTVVQPHPLTFLLINSLLEQFNTMAIGSESNEVARWNMLQSCAILTLFRALEVNLFHIDIAGIAPASVGLGNNSDLIPLLKKLKQMTLAYIEGCPTETGSLCGNLEDDDPIQLVLDLRANHVATSASFEAMKRTITLYNSHLRDQALSTWARAVPYFYPKHIDRRQLLLLLLKECLSSGLSGCPEWKYWQLDLLCGRLSLPDLCTQFLPVSSREAPGFSDISDSSFSPVEPGLQELSPPPAPTSFDASNSLVSDDSLLVHHAGNEKMPWTPNQIRQSLSVGALSNETLLEYLSERGYVPQSGNFSINDPHSIDVLVAAYESLWENKVETDEIKSTYEVLNELPQVIELLVESIGRQTWSGLNRPNRKFKLIQTPLFVVDNSAQKRNTSPKKYSDPQNTFALNNRVLFIRSIQELMVLQLGGTKPNQPTPPDFDSSKCADTILLTDSGRTARQHSAKQWGMVMLSKGFAPNTGSYEWAVRLDKCEKGHIFLGMCTQSASVSTYVGGDRQGWGLIGTRALWHNRSKVRGDYGEGFSTGSTVRIRFNSNSGALSFGVDNSDWGVAFDGLTQCGTLYPAVGLYQRDDQVTILPVASQNEHSKSASGTPAQSIRESLSETAPSIFAPLLRHTFLILKECSALLSNNRGDGSEIMCFDVTDVSKIEALLSHPVISLLLPSLLSHICLLRTLNGLAGVFAMQILPWCIRIVKQLDFITGSKEFLNLLRNKLNFPHVKTSGLHIDISGEWELQSIAAGNIPAQKYRLRLKQNGVGVVCGESSGSFSAVSLTGAVNGTKLRFLETWKQGGTCLVEGRIRADGCTFSGTYEDTKSHTVGKISGIKAPDVLDTEPKSCDTDKQCTRNLVLLETIACTLIGKLCGTLIRGDQCELMVDQSALVKDENSESETTVTDGEQQSLGPSVEISGDEYSSWIESDLLSGGLPLSEIRSHLHSVLQRVADIKKQCCVEQVSGEISSTASVWLDYVLPSSYTEERDPKLKIAPEKSFLSDLVASRDKAAELDKWILRHVGESPFLRVGGEIMKAARKTVVAAMIWHSGCTQEALSHAEMLQRVDLNDSETRPSERLMLVWCTAQRVIEWAIRSKMSFGSTYSIMASFLIQKSNFLLELEPYNKVTAAASFAASSGSIHQVQAKNSFAAFEDYSQRLHSEQLMHLSRFLEASIRITRLRDMMLRNCTLAFLRNIGFMSLRFLLSETFNSTNAGSYHGALQLPCGIGTALNWLSSSLRGQQRKGLNGLSLKSEYYLDGIGGCGSNLRHDLREAFESLYALMAASLSQSSWTSNPDLQLSYLQSWGILIEAEDHAFLSRVGIFRILQTILDDARGLEDSKEDENKLDDCGITSQSRKRLVQAALKVVHLLAAQVATADQRDAEEEIASGASVPLARKPSGPETLGKSVFNMLYTELQNAVEQLRNVSESTRLSQGTLGGGPDAPELSSATEATPMGSEAHQYCYQICSLLFSVSSADTCRAHLSSSKWLRLLVALVDCGTPAIQQRVLRLLRRLLPSIDPSRIEVKLGNRPFSNFEVDSDDDIIEDPDDLSESRGISLICFLIDIIGSSMPPSLPAPISSRLYGEEGVATCLKHSSNFAPSGSLFDLAYEKTSSLSAEVVVLLRSLYAAPKWQDSLNAAILSSLKCIPRNFESTGEIAIDTINRWVVDDKSYRRGFAALSILGGYIDSLQVGATVKIVPRSGTSAQEIAFRGAKGIVISYDSQKSTAEILLNGALQSDAREGGNTSIDSKTYGRLNAANATTLSILRPVRIPVGDLSVVSEIEPDSGDLSENIGEYLCTSSIDFFLKELKKSIESSQVNSDASVECDSKEEEAEGKEQPPNEEKSDDPEISETSALNEVGLESNLNQIVICLFGLRGLAKILRLPKFSSKLIKSSANSMTLKNLFQIAVVQTNTKGLGDISYLEEKWILLWSHWYDLRRSRSNSIAFPSIPETEEVKDEEDEDKTLAPPSASCQQMMEMGFPREWCEIALQKCNKNVEAAINFCFEHSGDMERMVKEDKEKSKKLLSTASKTRGGSRKKSHASLGEKVEQSNPLLDQLSEMGFPLKWCKKALVTNRNNVDAALTWILSNGEMLEAEDRREAQEKKRASNRSAGNSSEKESSKVLNPNPLRSISGQASIGDDLCLEGLSGGGFASVGARDCLVSSGKWYYEATLFTSGCIQIGWADVAFCGSSDRGDGVGDGQHSWAYDGWRQQKWHGASSNWGSKWKAGDVIGCGVDTDAGTIFFSLNGKMRTVGMGVAFRGVEFSGGVYPCASFNRREKLQFNLGGLPFKHQPPHGFNGILSTIWDPKKEILYSEIDAHDGIYEDCLEEQVGEEHFGWQSRYFGKESSNIRSSGVNQRSGASPGMRHRLASVSEDIEEDQLYAELISATQDLAVLHARRALLTLLSSWPRDIVGPFSLQNMGAEMLDHTDELKEGSSSSELFVEFIKLAASLGGQLSGASTLLSSPDSPFISDDIIQLLDSGASGRHALFLLAPVLSDAICGSDSGFLLSNLLKCIDKQVTNAAKRAYSSVSWEASDALVTASLLQHSRGTDALWTDKAALQHPNMPLMEWLTCTIMNSSALSDELRLSLFKAWLPCLRSPNMCLKEKGLRFLSAILQDALPKSPLLDESVNFGNQALAQVSSLVSLLPSSRIFNLSTRRLCEEQRRFPVCSKYLQSLFEMSSSISMAELVLKPKGKNIETLSNLIKASNQLSSVFEDIDLKEIETAREKATERRAVEKKKSEDEAVQKATETENASAEEVEPGSIEETSTNMDVESTAASEDQATEDTSNNNDITSGFEESISDGNDQLTNAFLSLASSVDRMENEDVDADSSGIGSVSGMITASMMARQILLSQNNSSGFESKNKKRNDESHLSKLLDGDFEFPEPVISFDVLQLNDTERCQLEAAALGHMGNVESSWNFGIEANVLSDAAKGATYWSGTLIQHASRLRGSGDDTPELVSGCKVIRGPNWKWRDQDGGEGSVGVVESVSPWSGIEGEGMSIRWANDSLYTYRWGADGNYDLTHVEVDDEGKVSKKYPLPIKRDDDGKFGSELRTGVILRLFEDCSKTIHDKHFVPIRGTMEYPDYGATVLVVGQKNVLDESFWFQELQLLRGNVDMGWMLRFGSEKWQPGTKFLVKKPEQECMSENNPNEDNMLEIGRYNHKVVSEGKVVSVNGELRISRKHLFKMDSKHHFSNIKVAADGLSVTCSGGESRSLALGTVGFSSGVHYWELKVDQAEFGSVFLGVCEKAGPPGSQGATSSRLNRWNGWGFVNFRASYHNSTERIYGDHFNAGDTIGVRLDMDQGKLSFFMDGIKYGEHIVADLGVAFDNLRSESGIAQRTLFPCIGMRKVGDKISLNGKWVSKPELPASYLLEEAKTTSRILHSWVHSQSLKQVTPLPDSLIRQAWVEWKCWSEDRWKRYPIRPRGVVVDFDTDASSCAAISTAAGLAAPYLAGDRVKICNTGGRELDQAEEAVVLGAYRGFLWYRTETQSNEGTEEGRSWAWYWTEPELMGLILVRRKGQDMTLLENCAKDSSLGSADDVGKKLGLCHVEMECLSSFESFKKLSTAGWTTEMDIRFVEGINSLCDTVGLEPFNLGFLDVCSTEERLGLENIDADKTAIGGRSRTVSVMARNHFSDPMLSRLSGAQLRSRCALLRVFNGKILRVLPLINMQVEASSSFKDLDERESKASSLNSFRKNFLLQSTGCRLGTARRLIFTSTKRRYWDELLRSTTTNTPLSSDEYEDPREIRNIRINRIQAQASKLAVLPEPSDRLRRSVFGQLYREMRAWGDNAFRRAYCGKGHGGQRRAFKVKFLGEGVNDYGGPYRAIFEQVVDELQMDNVELTKGEQGLLPLLVPCPNRRSGTGSNQEKFMLNPSCGTSTVGNGPMALELYRFLGKLIGTAVRHGLQMGLDLPALIWRPLAGLSLARPHLESVDVVTANLLERIGTLKENGPDAEALLEFLRFSTHLSDGSEAVLLPNGAETSVTWNNRLEYIRLVEEKRLTESSIQLKALRDGLSCVLPMEVTPLFTSRELEVLICGHREVDVGLLKQCTEYEEVDENTPHVQYFWQVLEEMTNDERTKFLRFVWARSRMPNSAKDFAMNFKIQAAHDQGARDEPDKYLPHAQTCFFSLSLPAYSSKEILRTKLLFAIENSPNMDADVRLHNAEGWADA